MRLLWFLRPCAGWCAWCAALSLQNAGVSQSPINKAKAKASFSFSSIPNQPTMMSCAADSDPVAMGREFRMQLAARQAALGSRVTALLQIQAAMLMDRIQLHNPLMSAATSEHLFVTCFRVVCMGPVCYQVLELSQRLMMGGGNLAAVPKPSQAATLSTETIVSFLFAELDDMAHWMRPDRMTELGCAKVHEFMTARTEAMRKAMKLSPEKQEDFRGLAVLRYQAAGTNTADKWRCTCPRCAAWVAYSDSTWSAWKKLVLAAFPWFQVITAVDAQCVEVVKLLHNVPHEKVQSLMTELNVEARLAQSVRDVKARQISNGDKVLEEWMAAVKSAAQASTGATNGADAD